MIPSDIDLPFLCELLRQAGALALEQRRAAQTENGSGQVAAQAKADRTPVTAIDRQVEIFLIEHIRESYPEHAILSEESGLQNKENEFGWVLDPIDGTRAFASGLPVWGISAGVLRDGEPYAGGFFLPVTGELYWGTRDEAWLNERRLPKLRPGKADPLLSFLAVPSNFHLYFTVSAPRIRSMGSTAAHLAYVASGAAVGMLTRQVSLWDIAGVLPLALAVGVELVYFSGRPFAAGDLMDGRAAAEPLLAAGPGGLDEIQCWIQLKAR